MASVVTCPKCQKRLKLNKVPTEATKIQCPHCQQPFAVAGSNSVTARRPQATPPQAAPQAYQAGPPPQRSAPPPHRPAPSPRANPSPSRGPLIGTGAALIIALAVVGVGAAGIYFYVYKPGADSAAKNNAKNTADATGKADNHETADKNPDKEDKKDKKDKQIKRYRELAEKSAKAKNHKEAMHNYELILKQLPDDPEATEGLQRAQEELAKLADKTEKPMPEKPMPEKPMTAKEIDAKNAEKKALENEEKRKEDLAMLLEQGKEARAMKQYPQAEDFYKKALEIAPGDEDATRGLLAVRAALNLADLDRRFTSLLDAAKSNLTAGKYADAMRDASAAGQVMPANAQYAAAALEVYQQAEGQLTMLKGVDEKKQAYDKVMDTGTTALRELRYPEAFEAFTSALKLIPDDPAATKGLADAKTAIDQSKAQLALVQQRYQALMAQGALAMNAGLFADAARLFGQAVILVPNDPTAQTAYLNADGAMKRVVAYRAAMLRGQLSMINMQYADAMLAYSDALLNVPNDPFAQQGRQDAQKLLLGTLQTKQVVDFKLVQAALYFKMAQEAKDPADKIKQYAAACNLYVDAEKIMPNHPDNLITKNLIRYTGAMAKATASFTAKRYGDATTAYLEALRTVTDDPFAQQGLAQAMDLGGKMYVDSMDKGKKAIDAKNYPEAVARFVDALGSLTDDPLADVNYPQLPMFRAAAKMGLDDAQRLGKARYDDDMNRALQAMIVKNYNEAVNQYTDALRIIPNDPLASQGLSDAQKSLQAQKLAAGGDLARDFDARVKVADQLFSLQKYADASKAYNDAIKLQPSDLSVTVLQAKARFADAMVRGRAAMNLKNYVNAVAAFNDALTQLPNNADALQAKNTAQMLIDGTSANVAKDFADKVKQGDFSLGLKQYADASKAYHDALKIQPKDAGALHKAQYVDAMIRGQTAKGPADAAAAYGDALKAMPGDATALAAQKDAQQQLSAAGAATAFAAKVSLADKLLNGQKYGDAVKAYNDAVALMPGDPSVGGLKTKASFASSMVQAQAAMKAGQFDNAAAAYKQALTFMNDPAATQGLLDAQQRINAGQSAQALKTKLATAHTALQQQKYFEASKAFNEAIALLPPRDPQVAGLTAKVHYADAMANGRTALSTKNYPAAVGFFGDALKAQPNDLAANQGLQEAHRGNQAGQAKQNFDNNVNQGNLALTQQKYADAARFYSDAVKVLPTDKSAADVQKKAHYADAMARGKAAMGMNNFAAAVTAFADAMSKAPLGDMTAQIALLDAQQRAQAAAAGAAAAADAQRRKDFDGKVAQANALLAKNPPHYAEAGTLLNDAVRILPNDPSAREHSRKARYAEAMARGHTAMMQRNHKEAVHQFQLAVNEYPNDQPAMTALNNAKKAK